MKRRIKRWKPVIEAIFKNDALPRTVLLTYGSIHPEDASALAHYVAHPELYETKRPDALEPVLLKLSEEDNPFFDPDNPGPTAYTEKNCIVCGRPVELEGLTKHCFEHGYGNDWPEPEMPA